VGDHVNLAEGHLKVLQAVKYDANRKPVLREPKTTKSRRRVPLTQDLARELLRHHDTTTSIAKPLGLVFVSVDGGLTHPSKWSKKDFMAALQRAGLPRTVRLYDLRHSMATLALEAGVHPKAVSERLGHATTQLTLDAYSHMTPHKQERATESLANLIYGSSRLQQARLMN
jgi:integrase